jgi:hypothetical protein
MADGSAQKSIFCIYPGNRNWMLLARRRKFANSHQALARDIGRDAGGVMKPRTGADGQLLAAKWRRGRGRAVARSRD